MTSAIMSEKMSVENMSVEKMTVEKMTVEKMVELLAVRLIELGLGDAGDCREDVERERAYALEFCGCEEVDSELGAIIVELAAAAVLERSVMSNGAVQSVRMGDVQLGFGAGEDGARGLAAAIYRRAIARMAARRGIKW